MPDKFTPGPWEHHPAINYAGFSVAPKGILPTLAAVERPRGNPELCVVDCFNFPGSTEANARLIAASPCLLEAAISVVEAHESNDGQMDDLFGQDMIGRLKAAIAKATGTDA